MYYDNQTIYAVGFGVVKNGGLRYVGEELRYTIIVGRKVVPYNVRSTTHLVTESGSVFVGSCEEAISLLSMGKISVGKTEFKLHKNGALFNWGEYNER